MKLLTVDDHLVLREGLTAFPHLGPDTDILEAGDAPLINEHADLDAVVLSASENFQGACKALVHGRRQERNNLTESQIELLRSLYEGQASTTRITAIFKALNIVDKTQAAAVAREASLV